MDFDWLGDCYYNKGLEFAQNNCITEALDSLKKAVQFKSSKKAMNLLGLCFFLLGKFNEAKIVWEKSVSMDDSRDNMAASYLVQMQGKEMVELQGTLNDVVEYVSFGKYKKAVKVLKSKRLDRYLYIDIKNLYGLCLYGAGFKKDSIKMWKSVLELDKNNPDACRYILLA